jgi:hypothetical protein
MEVVYIMAPGCQKVFCYAYFCTYKSSPEKNSSEQNSSWRNIKIKYCIVWKKEKLYLLIKKEHNFY